MTRIRRRLLTVSLALGVSAWTLPTRADPQLNAGLLLGAAGIGYDRVWSETNFLLGARADVIFGREKNRDFGVGPYVDFETPGFKGTHFGGGASLVVPVLDSFPLVLSAGALGRTGTVGGLEGGVSGDLFFGSKSYNFHGPWVLTGGLVGSFQRSLGDTRETMITVGARLDLAIIALPFLFLANAARGGGADTAPVR